MELKEFIKNVLNDIIEGVEEVRSSSIRDLRVQGDKDKSAIEFEVAVTVESTESASKGGKIKVIELVQGGIETIKDQKNSSVSKIKFSVQIDSETKNESQRRIARSQLNHLRHISPQDSSI